MAIQNHPHLLKVNHVIPDVEVREAPGVVHQVDRGEHQGELDGVIATSPNSVEMAFMILPFTVLEYSVFFCCSLSLDYLQLHPTTTINCWHNIIQESPKTKKSKLQISGLVPVDDESG